MANTLKTFGKVSSGGDTFEPTLTCLTCHVFYTYLKL